jgi:hypothetical protein
MATEDDLGWEYFGDDPEQSPAMMEHMDWHNAPENQNRTGNYGERFLIFHRDYVAKFDQFRIGKGLLPVSGWDPATPIPADLAHPHVLMQARSTSDPYSVNPFCKTPTWATIAGGADLDPLYGYTKLGRFQSLDELGRSIDDGWHGTVHKWIDNVRRAWELSRHIIDFHRFAAVGRILFGIINDAPGVWIGPDGRPHPVPGGPGDPWRDLSPAARDLLVGAALHELGQVVSQKDLRDQVSRVGTALVKASGKQLL